MLRVLILYIRGGTYSLKSTPNDRFSEKLFMTILFTLRVFARNLLRGSRRRNIFHISFLITDLRYEPRLLHLTSRQTFSALKTILRKWKEKSYRLWYNDTVGRIRKVLWDYPNKGRTMNNLNLKKGDLRFTCTLHFTCALELY